MRTYHDIVCAAALDVAIDGLRYRLLECSIHVSPRLHYITPRLLQARQVLPGTLGCGGRAQSRGSTRRRSSIGAAPGPCRLAVDLHQPRCQHLRDNRTGCAAKGCMQMGIQMRMRILFACRALRACAAVAAKCSRQPNGTGAHATTNLNAHRHAHPHPNHEPVSLRSQHLWAFAWQNHTRT